MVGLPLRLQYDRQDCVRLVLFTVVLGTVLLLQGPSVGAVDTVLRPGPKLTGIDEAVLISDGRNWFDSLTLKYFISYFLLLRRSLSFGLSSLLLFTRLKFETQGFSCKVFREEMRNIYRIT